VFISLRAVSSSHHRAQHHLIRSVVTLCAHNPQSGTRYLHFRLVSIDPFAQVVCLMTQFLSRESIKNSRRLLYAVLIIDFSEHISGISTHLLASKLIR
jgi:hypothetical protein